MTDLASHQTTSTADDAQRLRVEQLQRRRASRAVADQLSPPSTAAIAAPTGPAPRRTSKRSRTHPAIGARIGAAGFGLVTMFGLVALMGLAQPSTATSAPAPAVAAPAEVVVVIHRTGTGTVSPIDATTSVAAAPAASAPAASAPIALTARPTVKAAAPAQAQPAPVARTNGSR